MKCLFGLLHDWDSLKETPHFHCDLGADGNITKVTEMTLQVKKCKKCGAIAHISVEAKDGETKDDH